MIPLLSLFFSFSIASRMHTIVAILMHIDIDHNDSGAQEREGDYKLKLFDVLSFSVLRHHRKIFQDKKKR